MFSVFSMLPVRERENGVKTLQKCSGAPLWLTWLANYCWDLLNALPSLLMIIIIFASSQSIAGFATFAEKTGKVYLVNTLNSGKSESQEKINGPLDCIFVLFILFALAQLPFTYCLSFAFKVSYEKHLISTILYGDQARPSFAVNFSFPFFSVNPIFLCQSHFSLSIPNFLSKYAIIS